MNEKTVKIGLMGLGTVGCGTWNALEMNREAIKKNTGLDLQIKKVLVRDLNKKRGADVPAELLTDKPEVLLSDPDIDIIVGLMGIGDEAKYFLAAMEGGKHVVTANKAAVARDYQALRAAAEANKVLLRYEASVGGAIPVITALTNPLLSNCCREVLGIVNGTTNYILTQMSDNGLDYATALKQAQELGFAEPDPTADVEGFDAANKLAILMSLAFGKTVSPGDIPTTGITGVTKEDIESAKAEGCRIKLIAGASLKDGKLEYSVKPTKLPLSHPLAGVNNEFNAIFVTGNACGELMFYGRGAGSLPTGSAVLGDIIDVAKAIVKDAAYDNVVAGAER